MSNAVPDGWDRVTINDNLALMTDYVANGSFESLRNNVQVFDERNHAMYVRLYDIRLGVGHGKQKYVDKNTFEFLRKSKLVEGDILIANIGANVGEIFLMPKTSMPSTLAPNMVMMRCNKSTIPTFLYYFMSSDIGQRFIALAISGSGQPKLNKTDLKKVTSILPPLPEQEKIAAILSSVDDVIEKTQGQINKLKDLKIGMIRELLTKGIGHTEFKDSPVGRIPVEWSALTIRELVKFIGGSQPPRDTFVFEQKEGYVRLLQIRDYKSDRYATYIQKELPRRWCDKDDIMIGRYGPPIFQILRGKEGSYNVALIKAEPMDNRLDKGYLYHFLCRNDLFQLIDSYSQRTSGQTGIDMDALKDFGFPLPSLEEQKEIANRLDHLDNTIGLKKLKFEYLQNTKKALMQDLLTGKVRVTVD
ncbi:MAG: restriction endonuclease subunit S [Gammaproteobacteria bacterium]|nr:restriction endonuclease subunit S [Gammaproteobacteria bacterium]